MSLTAEQIQFKSTPVKPTNDKITISIFDNTGRLVSKNTGVNVNGIYTLDLSNQANGIYFIQLTLNGKTVSKKVSINK